MGKIDVGSRVVIYRKGNALETCWVAFMDSLVGSAGVVVQKIPSSFDVQLDNGHAWWIPRTCLKHE